MQTKFTDVAHLYLGCDVQTNFRIATSSGKQLKKLKGVLKEVDLGMESALGILLENETDKCNYKNFQAKDIKPILKPLSSLKQEELTEQGFRSHRDWITHEKGDPLDIPFRMALYLIK